MARRTRRPRRVGRVVDLPAVLWRYLADFQEPGDEEDSEFVNFYFFGDPAPEKELWKELGAAATAEYAQAYPGRRPRLWWRYTAPEPERRVVAGSGESSGSVAAQGVPFLLGEDPDDPALIESEPAYLARLDLFLPGERRRLRDADFKPVPASDWSDDDDGDPPPGAAIPPRKAA